MNWKTGLFLAARRSFFFCALPILLCCVLSMDAFSVVVDDGQLQQPTSIASQVVSMPFGPPSSALSVGSRGTVNLGTFNIVINPGPTLASNAPALTAFNRAAQLWEAFIADPIVVTIDADLASLGPGIIGGTDAVLLFDTFNVIRSAMVDDAGDGETDDGIVAFLPTASQYGAFLPTGFGFDGNLQVTKANAKALNFDNRFGDLDTQFGVSDGDIVFSSTFPFDFDNSDGVNVGAFDFESVAAHEIGHLLGFISDVDYVDFILDLGQVALDVAPTSLDLFRFESGTVSAPPAVLNPTTTNEFTTSPRWMVPGFDAIFDQIDGSFGGDVEVRMSTGLSFGDGRQASHWKDSLGLGILDPTLAFGEISLIRPNDLRALDLIGYEITIPEPASLSLLVGIACCACGWRGPRLA